FESIGISIQHNRILVFFVNAHVEHEIRLRQHSRVQLSMRERRWNQQWTVRFEQEPHPVQLDHGGLQESPFIENVEIGRVRSQAAVHPPNVSVAHPVNTPYPP